MNVTHTRAPHAGQSAAPVPQAPNAALLIDFDNVTMGIRSDITKELKNLLNSAIIKGKVAVQRAYADWRRYPQYVVPLAEASVDLIFAPAYGSSKKNATDIRLSIDALELVFTRPEIGVFILLSGDSDFSSLVLKLKEYGKYVIGVGIRESASDLLVQNCDEYYSYSAITGLTRAGEDSPPVSHDPWELVDAAVTQMASEGDVMRSDRLKQVLLDLDPNFDEKNLGFSKFNRFVAEASNRGVLRLHKLENGQYEIALPTPDDQETAPPPEPRRGRGRKREKPPEPTETKAVVEQESVPEQSEERAPGKPAATEADRLRESYDLLRHAARELGASPENAVRDSDVKRRILDLQPEWDESQLGFSKFSRFLRQAHDAEAINLQKLESGIYEMTLPADGAAAAPGEEPAPKKKTRERRGRREKAPAARKAGADEAETPELAVAPGDEPESDRAQKKKPARKAARRTAKEKQARKPARKLEPEAGEATATSVPDAPAEADARADTTPPSQAVSIGLRRGSRGRLLKEPPPLLEGQLVGARAVADEKVDESAGRMKGRAEKPAKKKKRAARKRAFDAAALGLPTAAPDVIKHISSYKGIGPRSANAFAKAVGPDNVFATLNGSPEKVREVLGAKRGETLLTAWRDDYALRVANTVDPAAPMKKPASTAMAKRSGSRSRTRTGRRPRKKRAKPSA